MQERNPLEVKVDMGSGAKLEDSNSLLGEIIATLEKKPNNAVFVSRLMQVERLPIKSLMAQKLDAEGMNWKAFLERDPAEVEIISSLLGELLLTPEDKDKKIKVDQIVKELRK